MRSIVRQVIPLIGLLCAVPAFGDLAIAFTTGTGGTGGTFTLNGTNATGFNIPVGLIAIAGATLDNGAFLVTGACNGGSACLDFNTAANTISIVGAIPGLGVAAETLLSGSISSFAAGSTGLTSVMGSDVIAANLLADIGASGGVLDFAGFSLTSIPVSNGGSGPVFTSTIATFPPMPEPDSVGLLAIMLLGGYCVAARRRSRSV